MTSAKCKRPMDGTYRIKTAWGAFGVRFKGGKVSRFWFPGDAPPAPALEGQMGAAGRALTRHLRAYLAGNIRRMTVPVDMSGGTVFDQKVWRALARIPYGQVRTYSALAAAIGRPKAARAVGGACGRNPVPLLVPCHRAVGAGGRLAGFSASGGKALKRRLLELEGARYAE
jgi:methylated-DNA-[protein]-cysteine S-methyltransferase